MNHEVKNDEVQFQVGTRVKDFNKYDGEVVGIYKDYVWVLLDGYLVPSSIHKENLLVVGSIT